MTPINYLRELEQARNTPFKIKDGKGFDIINGELVPMEKSNIKYPTSLTIRVENKLKGMNCDHTKDWTLD